METSGKFIGFIFLFFVLVQCQADSESDLIQQLQKLSESHIEDSRTRLFEYELNNNVVRGFTDQPELKAKLHELLKTTTFTDSVALVPHPDLKSDTLALISVSVANIRSQPKHSAELGTQALMGTPVRVLYKTGSWYRVQTPDQYLGYIESGVLSFVHQIPAHRYVFSEPLGFIYSEPNINSVHVSDLVLGNLLEVKEKSNAFYRVVSPDGRQGYVPASQLVLTENYLSKASESELGQLTSQFLGVPYLWGGTSFKGVDCSGFTKNAMLQKGLYLPRDASQQALVGDEIDTSKSFENLQRGDLLFFGPSPAKVTHVAIYLGNLRFIHSSGMVKYGSFDQASPEYDEFNHNRFLFAKRVLESNKVARLNPDTFY